MNLRWLPYFEALGQVLRLKPARYNFSPTQHEPLAQQPGKKTYFFDRQQRLWKCLGSVETKGAAFSMETPEKEKGIEYEEICASGIESVEPLELQLRPYAYDEFGPGSYEIQTLFSEKEAGVVGDRVFDLVLCGGKRSYEERADIRERVDIVGRTGAENGILRLTHTLEIDQGFLSLKLIPVKGKALICGVVISPVRVTDTE